MGWGGVLGLGLGGTARGFAHSQKQTQNQKYVLTNPCLQQLLGSCYEICLIIVFVRNGEWKAVVDVIKHVFNINSGLISISLVICALML